MGWRAIISITQGRVDIETWAKAAAEEPLIPDEQKACKECPLRKGGELEEGAKNALEQATDFHREMLMRWGCHQGSRPCAGMRRLLSK